jgi:hypothetical protein
MTIKPEAQSCHSDQYLPTFSLQSGTTSFELFLYYPGHRQVPATLRAFIDLIRATHGSASVSRSLQNPFTKH